MCSKFSKGGIGPTSQRSIFSSVLVRQGKITRTHIPKLFQFVVSNTVRRNILEKLITKSETHFLIKIGDGFHLKSFFPRLT